MVTDEVEDWFSGGKLAGEKDGVAVTSRFGLNDKTQSAGPLPGRPTIVGLIPGGDDDCNLFRTRPNGLFDQNSKCFFLDPIAIYDRLQEQAPLIAPRRRDHRFANFHDDWRYRKKPKNGMTRQPGRAIFTHPYRS
jgi:hypothetical protein